MVYCGRPSESCAPCRAKKRRCDKARPSCGQCRRAGTACSGYRSAQDIANPFRDQTQPIVAKFKTARKQNRKSSVVVIRRDGLLQPAPDLATNLSPHADQLAVSVFYSRVASTDGGLEPYARTVINSIELRSADSSPLHSIMLALGLRAVADERKSANVNALSTNRYTQAISLTNKALSDPGQAVKDDTLMTVMLLALYETVTATTAQQFRSWAAHIDGATSLLRLRGSQQFQTREGLVMFLHLRSRIIRACIERVRPVPPDLIALSNESRAYQTADELKGTETADMATQFCALRHSMQKGTLSAPDDIVEALLALDTTQDEWFHNLPQRFLGNRIDVAPTPLVFGDHYIAYDSRSIENTVSNNRLMRLMVNQDLRKFLPLCNKLSDVAARQARVSQVITELCRHLCLSIPVTVGHYRPFKGHSPELALSSRTHVAWFLFAIAREPSTPAAMRNWVMMQLVYLSDEAGIHQARTLMHVIGAGREIGDWAQLNKPSPISTPQGD